MVRILHDSGWSQWRLGWKAAVEMQCMGKRILFIQSSMCSCFHSSNMFFSNDFVSGPEDTVVNKTKSCTMTVVFDRCSEERPNGTLWWTGHKEWVRGENQSLTLGQVRVCVYLCVCEHCQQFIQHQELHYLSEIQKITMITTTTIIIEPFLKTIISSLPGLSHFISMNGNYFIPILQVRRLRHTEYK